MGVTRRYFVGGASALAVSGSSAAFAENKDPGRGPTLISAAADPTDFEAALRSKFSTGDVLNWTGGNVRLKRPIVIDVTASLTGAGVDLNGARIIADFNDPNRSTLTVQRTGPGSCLIFDGAANTMMVAVIAMARDTQVGMMNRSSGCKHVPLPELGREAFGEHSCSSGNTNAVTIYVWKNGKQATILFAPTKPHPESGSVEHLKAVAGRVYQKL